MIKFISNYMNSQAQILNPSFSLHQSNLSLGKPQAPSGLYTTSQVNLFPGRPQQQYFVTSSIQPQQANISIPPQPLAGSRLNTFAQYGNAASTSKIYQGTQVLTEKKESESRITYHPYVRTYIDYEERVVLVPVERVKINYYEKIYETQYVPQAIEEIITQTVPVEKEYLNVRYIPVQQKIVHFPKEEKKATEVSQVKKIIYFNAKGEQITEEQRLAILNANTYAKSSTVLINSHQNISSQQFQSIPIPSSYIPPVVNQTAHVQFSPQPQVQRPSEISERYMQEEQIILNDKSQVEKKLGESQVKEIYKPNYDPKNEPLNTF